MSSGHDTSNPVSVRDYLLAAFKVSTEDVAAAIRRPKYADRIEQDRQNRAHAYYSGDYIAAQEGWDENPDYEEPEIDNDEW